MKTFNLKYKIKTKKLESMRFLKHKIARSAELKTLKLDKAQTVSRAQEPLLKLSPMKQLKQPGPKSPCKSELSPRKANCENIIKNYGRAMTNFALSPLALPYLKTILPKSGSDLPAFLNFIKKKKKSANCIKKLREILPSGANQGAPNYAEKLAFQELCVVFLKFFCANWLFNSKIDNKTAHLAYRFKILRRIKNPDHFTYLKDFKFESK